MITQVVDCPVVPARWPVRWPVRWLAFLAGFSLACYTLIALLSWRFVPEVIDVQRPLLTVLVLFAVLFVCYLVAIWLVTRANGDPRALRVILVAAVLFRLVLLASHPIQEVDIYRYVWDGLVANQGVSPFRYSPQQVREAVAGGWNDERMERLILLRDQQPAAAEILENVHFSHLPTIYPPVSQVVFAAAVWTMPDDVPVAVRLAMMKGWLTAFDLATLALVLALLRRTELPDGLVVIHAWCPLVMKEVANSGHLDSIAVFFTTLTVFLTVRWFMPSGGPGTTLRSNWRLALQASVIGLVLTAGVGAKLYPLILTPLVLAALIRVRWWSAAMTFGLVLLIGTSLVLWPMMPAAGREDVGPQSQERWAQTEVLPPPTTAPGPVDPSLGLSAFLSQWEMNDFLFMILVENLRPDEHLAEDRRPWFVMVPSSVRRAFVDWGADRFEWPATDVPFLLARAVTMGLFLGIAAWLAWWSWRDLTSHRWLEAAFLTVAWFWLLCPTQNPWYWLWALPLLPWARNRTWLLVAGIVFLYYLRFWFRYHMEQLPVAGTGYQGTDFFDLIVTWIEWGPWFCLLLLTFLLGARITRRPALRNENVS